MCTHLTRGVISSMHTEQLESLPADEGACDEAADDADTAAARIAIGDRGVMERYQALKRAIDTQRTQQATQAAALVTLQVRQQPPPPV